MEDKINNIYMLHNARLIILLNQIHDKFLINFPHITKMIICYLEEHTCDIEEELLVIKKLYMKMNDFPLDFMTCEKKCNSEEHTIFLLSNKSSLCVNFYKTEHKILCGEIFDKVTYNYKVKILYVLYNSSYSHKLTYKYHEIPNIMSTKKHLRVPVPPIISDNKKLSKYCMLIMSKIVDKLMTHVSKSKQTDKLIRLTLFIDDFIKTAMTDKIFKSLFE